MQPSAKPSQSTSNHNERGESPPYPPSPAVRHVSPVASAAMQGANLAFKQTAKTIGDANVGHRLSPSQPASPKQADTNAKRSSSFKTEPDTTGLPENNGALLAATQAARKHEARSKPAEGPGHTTSSLSRHATSGGGEGGVREVEPGSESGYAHSHGGLVTQRLSKLPGGEDGSGTRGTNTNMTLLPPPSGGPRIGADSHRHGSTSPSLIAATLAASRSASPARDPSPQPSVAGGAASPGRTHSVGANSMANLERSNAGARVRLAEADSPDTASIQPTTALVSLFEGKGAVNVDPVKKDAPLSRPRSPVPMALAGLGSTRDQLQGAKPNPKPTLKPKPKPKGFTDGDRLGPSDGAKGPLRQIGQNEEETQSHRRDNNEVDSLEMGVQTRGQKQRQSSPKEITSRLKQVDRPLTPLSPDTARNLSSKLHTPLRRNHHEATRPKPPTPTSRSSSAAKAGESTIQTSLIKPEPAEMIPRRTSQSSVSSDDTFVSASSVQSRAILPTRDGQQTSGQATQLRRVQSSKSLLAPEPRRPAPSPAASAANLTLSSLTNAIVASNLASTRLSASSTPQPPPPLPAPRRSGRSHAPPSPLQPQRTAESIRSQLTGGRSKSPQHPNPPQRTGVLLQTLRGPDPSLSDDEDARRRRQHHGHHRRRNKMLHPGGNRKHAHHEGSRRRYRDEITPRERRRYEAVWASNRGLFLKPGWAFQYHYRDSHDGDKDPSSADLLHRIQEDSRAVDGPEADLVANVVARDIWRRSRLPPDELAEVWDLVDRSRRGALSRDEFVVGMWLIDQRLRGRKIPARVGQSVWDSAGGRGPAAGGVVVPLPKGGRKKASG